LPKDKNNKLECVLGQGTEGNRVVIKIMPGKKYESVMDISSPNI
jgi:hypothetical protein